MTVFVLIREGQNEHGYVDTSIAGIPPRARRPGTRGGGTPKRSRAGLIVEDDDSPDGEWQVSWILKEYAVS